MKKIRYTVQDYIDAGILSQDTIDKSTLFCYCEETDSYLPVKDNYEVTDLTQWIIVHIDAWDVDDFDITVEPV